MQSGKGGNSKEIIKYIFLFSTNFGYCLCLFQYDFHGKILYHIN